MLGDWIMVVLVWGTTINVTGFQDRPACLAAAERVVLLWPARGIPVETITCKRLTDV